jgi:Ca-activated chloride channel family protein
MKRSVSRRDLLRAAAAGFLISRNAGAQSSAGAAAAVNSPGAAPVVSLFATVYGQQGNIAADLTKEDFEVLDQGRTQTITHFSRAAELPLTLGLMIDISCPQRIALDDEKKAAVNLLRRLLSEGKDTAFVIDFDALAHVAQNVTSSRLTLEQSIEGIHLSQCRVENLENGGSLQIGTHGVGTKLFDAVYSVSEQLMSKRSGRKSLILLTDGTDRASRTTLAKAIEQIQRADTLVYSIKFGSDFSYIERQGLGSLGVENPAATSGVDAKEILGRLSRQTGGGYFALSKKVTLDHVYDRIEEALRNQYSLGFTPDKQNRGYHKVIVKVRRNDVLVQAREGYYQGR